jgi:hypothetical protein
MPELQTVFDRLERLERQNRMLKTAGVLALGAVSALVLMAQVKPASRVVEAGEFILRDPEGRMRAHLSISQGAPVLDLLDVTGKTVVELTSAKPGPSLRLGAPKQSPLILLSVSEDGPNVIVVMSKNGSQGVLSVEDDSGPILNLHKTSTVNTSLSTDRLTLINGESNAALSVGDVGDVLGPILQLLRKTPTGKVWLHANAASLALTDSDGYQTEIGSTELKSTLTGESHKTSAASLVMLGKDDKVIWRAP